jgi:hypothetical protein
MRSLQYIVQMTAMIPTVKLKIVTKMKMRLPEKLKALRELKE